MQDFVDEVAFLALHVLQIVRMRDAVDLAIENVRRGIRHLDIELVKSSLRRSVRLLRKDDDRIAILRHSLRKKALKRAVVAVIKRTSHVCLPGVK